MDVLLVIVVTLIVLVFCIDLLSRRKTKIEKHNRLYGERNNNPYAMTTGDNHGTTVHSDDELDDDDEEDEDEDDEDFEYLDQDAADNGTDVFEHNDYNVGDWLWGYTSIWYQGIQTITDTHCIALFSIEKQPHYVVLNIQGPTTLELDDRRMEVIIPPNDYNKLSIKLLKKN